MNQRTSSIDSGSVQCNVITKPPNFLCRIYLDINSKMLLKGGSKATKTENTIYYSPSVRDPDKVRTVWWIPNYYDLSIGILWLILDLYTLGLWTCAQFESSVVSQGQHKVWMRQPKMNVIHLKTPTEETAHNEPSHPQLRHSQTVINADSLCAAAHQPRSYQVMSMHCESQHH